MKASTLLQMNYWPLLAFANADVTGQNWKDLLTSVESWQLEWRLGLESGEPAVPKINGVASTFHRTRELQTLLRKELAHLARLCLDSEELARELQDAPPGARSTDTAWTWRKALVLPTKELFFGDAGEALRFLSEELEHEVKSRAAMLLEKNAGRKRKPLLHLSLCSCGCNQFFVWVGNGRRQRKFLDDKHRMKFHNARNVEKKKLLARQRRNEGNPRYF